MRDDLRNLVQRVEQEIWPRSDLSALAAMDVAQSLTDETRA